jgi:hypothetical protein
MVQSFIASITPDNRVGRKTGPGGTARGASPRVQRAERNPKERPITFVAPLHAARTVQRAVAAAQNQEQSIGQMAGYFFLPSDAPGLHSYLEQ